MLKLKNVIVFENNVLFELDASRTFLKSWYGGNKDWKSWEMIKENT